MKKQQVSTTINSEGNKKFYEQTTTINGALYLKDTNNKRKGRRQYTAITQDLSDIRIITAKKALFVSLRTIHQKTGDNITMQMINTLNTSMTIDNTVYDVNDLLHVAYIALIEYTPVRFCDNDSSLWISEAYNYVIPGKAYNKDGNTRIATPFLMAMRAVQAHIHDQKSNKGRKQISNTEYSVTPSCTVYDGNGNIKQVINYKPEKVTTAHGYKIELISLESHIEKPENYDRLNNSYIIKCEALYDDAKNSMKKGLSKLQSDVFDMLQEGMTGKEIAEKLNNHPNTIYTIIARIRQKIANSGQYDEYEAVRKYKTN